MHGIKKNYRKKKKDDESISRETYTAKSCLLMLHNPLLLNGLEVSVRWIFTGAWHNF